ncbi:MAG: DUF4294 domain-containing protein [Bacteroidales bacterium]|nr:DUF4294 domain-containing protein [Bacteroidales bacterium]MBR1577839.1 DUF4294 domain-containing protein [Bacteroidales bacterium]
MMTRRTMLIPMLATLAALLLAGAPARAQSQEAREGAREAVRQARRPLRGTPMYFELDEHGDTVFMETLEPVWIFPRGRRMRDGDWRRFYKLVFNFNKVYPYALVGRKMMAQVDSTLAADVTKRSERNRYINDVEKELFRLFEKDIRNMTISQGLVLMRLVDRECGMSAFSIIKTYENGFAANFWQLVARIFSQNLKTRYDPSKGEDAKIEELCKIWDSGQWDSFYFSIFMEPPRKTVIQRETLDSEVQRKNR